MRIYHFYYYDNNYFDKVEKQYSPESSYDFTNLTNLYYPNILNFYF